MHRAKPRGYWTVRCCGGGDGSTPRSQCSASQISSTWHIARCVRGSPRRVASSARRCRQWMMPVAEGPGFERGASMVMLRVSLSCGGRG